jgi:hypothetical protein
MTEFRIPDKAMKRLEAEGKDVDRMRSDFERDQELAEEQITRSSRGYHGGPPFTAQQAVARRTDPETSHLAAATIYGVKLRRSQEHVLRVLRAKGPMTDEELVNAYGEAIAMTSLETGPVLQTDSGIRTRRRELTDLALVEDSGERRPTHTGNQAIVWRVKSEPSDL